VPPKPAARPVRTAPAATSTRPQPTREQLTSSARWALIGSTLVTLAIYITPGLQLIAIPLLYLSTMVHEMGHGVGALLAGGDWIEFRLFADGSGYALSAREAGFDSALTAAAGLVGPAIAAAAFMALGLRARLARWGLGAAGAFFAFTLVFYVRGTFGFTFVAAVAGACLFIAIRASDETARIALLFFATQLALSVYSRGDYLFEDYVDGEMSGGKRTASDVQHMADAVGMPYWFWGLVCAAFSAAVLAVAAWLYIRSPRVRSRPAA
jgi:hypothetical protein